jgi:hypothetical protein
MELQEKIGIKTRYRLIEADPAKAPIEYEALLAFLRENPIENCRDSAPSAKHLREVLYRNHLNAYHDKAMVAVHEYDNLCPTVGRGVLAQRLANTTTYTGIINYAALGSGSTAPANGDTTLGTEAYRKTIDSQSISGNIAYLSVFIAQGVATATHYEAGLFIDGTGSANTGQLFSHVLLTPPVAKTALVSLTLDITITIS